MKNETGILGKICNNCGGYGFLNTLSGTSSGCMPCGQTGVAKPTVEELQEEIKELRNLLLSKNFDKNTLYGNSDS
jgi:hypothetical protein